MKLSSVTIFPEYARQIKANLVLVVILVSESKALYFTGYHPWATPGTSLTLRVRLLEIFFGVVLSGAGELGKLKISEVLHSMFDMMAPDCVEKIPKTVYLRGNLQKL